MIIANGFLLTAGNKDYFLISENKNITDKIAKKFINKICALKKITNKEIYLSNADLLKDFKYRIDNATLENKETYYLITGKNFSISIPDNDMDDLIIFT